MNKNSFFNQFAPEQIRAQFAKNARQLREMQAEAEKTGKQVNGYSAQELALLAVKAEDKAKCAS